MGKIGVSAACAHLGCLVHWHGSDQAFHCPCHYGIFLEEGEGDTHSHLLSPPTSTVAGKRCAGEDLRPRSVEPTRSAVFTHGSGGSASSVGAAGVASRLATLECPST